MCSIKVDDVFDELVSENRKLLEVLAFANDLIDCLLRLRNCLIDFDSKCNCIHNCDNKTYFQLLNNKYRKIIDGKDIKCLTAYCSRLSYLDQVLKSCDNNRVVIKQEPTDWEDVRESSQEYRSSCLKNNRRKILEIGENSRIRRKRKSVTFNETNNTFNEYEAEQEVQVIPEGFGDMFEEQFLIRSTKMSTTMSKDEISQKVANDECIARVDSNQRNIKILYSSAMSMGTTFSDDLIVGFGCCLCDFVSNRKNNITTHFLIKHSTNKNKIVDRSQTKDKAINQTKTIIKQEKELEHESNESVIQDVIQKPTQSTTQSDESVIIINATKVSTKYPSLEIRQYIENKPNIALADMDNAHVQIFFRNNGKTPCDETMIGFGCNLCDFLSNRKHIVKQHLLKHHPKIVNKKKPKPPVESNANDISNSIRTADERPSGQQFSSFDIDSILESSHPDQQLANGLNESNPRPSEGKCEPISLEKIIRDEIGDLIIVEEMDNFGLNIGESFDQAQPAPPPDDDELDLDSFFADEPVSLNLDSESEHEAELETINILEENDEDFEPNEKDLDEIDEDIDDADDEDWGKHKKRKRKKLKKAGPGIVVKSRTKKFKRFEPSVPIVEIQKKLSNDECDIEKDKDHDIIKIIFNKSDFGNDQKRPIGYMCGWIGCDKVFGRRNQIMGHICAVHEKQGKSFVCDYGDCTYQGMSALHLTMHRRNHIRAKHLADLGLGGLTSKNPKNKVPLELLKALYAKGNQLTEEVDKTNENVLTVNEEDFPRVMGYKCGFPNCLFIQQSKQKTVEHINGKHLHKRVQCDWPSCEYTGYNYTAMKRHREVHLDIRPFACTWPGCEQRCRRKTHLISHMITHGTERPFKCDWPSCDKGFRSESSLRSHRVTHTRIKMKQCPWPGCISTFRDGAGLNNHVMIHKGVWPFNCLAKDCSKRFRQKTAMLTHFRRHHPERLDLLNGI